VADTAGDKPGDKPPDNSAENASFLRSLILDCWKLSHWDFLLLRQPVRLVRRYGTIKIERPAIFDEFSKSTGSALSETASDRPISFRMGVTRLKQGNADTDRYICTTCSKVQHSTIIQLTLGSSLSVNIRCKRATMTSHRSSSLPDRAGFRSSNS
jgi:hypothetical protein